ncbi:hypothetical protein KUCAC02_017664, partial [Chaenocephalus aceratus]
EESSLDAHRTRRSAHQHFATAAALITSTEKRRRADTHRQTGRTAILLELTQ